MKFKPVHVPEVCGNCQNWIKMSGGRGLCKIKEDRERAEEQKRERPPVVHVWSENSITYEDDGCTEKGEPD